MALTALSLAKEDQGTALLLLVHRLSISPRELIYWRIGKDEREFEFGDGAGKHGEIDRATRRNRGKQRAKELPIRGGSIQTLQDPRADGVIPCSGGIGRRKARTFAVVELIDLGADGPGRTGESRDLDELGRRHMRLRDREVGDDRIIGRKPRRSLRKRELESE